MKAKELLAAGYVRDILFRDKEAFDLYLYDLDHKKKVYEILDTFDRDDGSIIVRILQQYNSAPLIQLYEDDDTMNDWLSRDIWGNL